ncbi:MAG: hypothetical protein JWO11_1664 [Nocardioides sp.]|nr:hypothetical protein [Nocardioides sp.]
MSTTKSEPVRVRGQLARLLAFTLVSTLLSGCSLLGSDDPAPPRTTSSVPADVVAALTRTLDRRSAAVRRGNQARFMSGIGRARPGFSRDQATYFDNLAQLPLGEFRYTFDPREMVRTGDDYWVVVDVHLQLEGYDAVPVASPDRYRFTPSPRRPGAFLLASVTDSAWERRNDVRPQPWDSGRIDVASDQGVLGIFDQGSDHAATGLLGSVRRGISDVAGIVPYDWSRSVVVYALSDTTFLSAIDDLPGDDPEGLDGVAFPVPSSPDGGELAATRFVLNPRMLDRPGTDRDRLIRHELTHVAIGVRDDHAPVWLSEGIAEYVSYQPLAPPDRSISGAALAAAERGVQVLPADATFNDGESATHYGLAWWACEYIARSYGRQALWSLLERLNTSAASETDQEQVLQNSLGIGGRELARRAGHLLVVTFDPGSLLPEKPPQAPEPTGSAPTPGASPSVGGTSGH